MRLRARALTLAAAALVLLVAAAPSGASEIVDRGASRVNLAVDTHGVALVTYFAHGSWHHVLYWDAVNGAADFRRDYSGGWKSRVADWKHFHNACRPYSGPALQLAVATCDAPDGSHWALQSWTRLLPDYGGTSGPLELHLSHWTGGFGDLSISTDWGYHGRFQHLYGTFRYQGRGVFGLSHTLQGVPTDAQGRNVYVDYLRDGRWARENSFLTHPDRGGFCYLFSPHHGHVGTGSRYRATVIGPGVTPIVRAYFDPPAAFTAATDALANHEERVLLGRDHRCKVN
jgi:hypothetical protein